MENDDIIVSVFEGTEYKFHADQISCLGLTAVYPVQEAADILAANLDLPTIDEDGTVDINENNFNDCYEDMFADLRGEVDEDE